MNFIKNKLRKFMEVWIIPLLCCVGIFSCNEQSANNKKSNTKKNILFIIVDDLRPELGCYGVSQIQTPNIDKLAEEGQLFERAYCQMAVCAASRASMFTGAYPTKNRFLNSQSWIDQEMPESINMFKHFKNNGYYTASFGKVIHHSEDQRNSWSKLYIRPPRGSYNWRGYADKNNIKTAIENINYSLGPAYERANVSDTAYYDGIMTQAVLAELKRVSTRNDPFCIAVGYIKPHLPFNAPEKYWSLYDSTQFDLPPTYYPNESIPKEALHNWGELRTYTNIPTEGRLSDELAKTLIHGYYACTSYIDTQIGYIINELKRLDLYENTIIILLGDHGWNLGDHGLWSKGCLFESSLHTPLIMKIPRYENGIRIKPIIPLVDIYPTLCELLSLPVPHLVEGNSFLDKIKNPSMDRNYAYSRYSGRNAQSLATDRYLYSRYLDQDNKVIANMLFDHAIDPNEINNLNNSIEYKNLIDSFESVLDNNEFYK